MRKDDVLLKLRVYAAYYKDHKESGRHEKEYVSAEDELIGMIVSGAEAEGLYKKTYDLLCATMLVFRDMIEFMPETIPNDQIGKEMQERIDKLEKDYAVWEAALEAAEEAKDE